eukprot:g1370.t1
MLRQRPASTRHCRALRLIELNNNRIDGPIPLSIGKCTELRELYLEANRLSGPIPPSLGTCTALKALVLDNNELSGQIPDSICRLSTLQELSAYSNRLTGPIPASLFADLSEDDDADKAEHTALTDGRSRRSAWVGNDKTSRGSSKRQGTDEDEDKDEGEGKGEGEREKARCRRPLRLVDLSGNLLSGQLKDCGFGAHLRDLKFLDLSSNCLSGRLPPGLGECGALEHLSLADNKLYGGVAESPVWRLTRLVHLDMSENGMFGPLPRAALSRMVRLRELRWHSNELLGELPLDAFARLAGTLTHVILAPGNSGLDGQQAQREAALRRLLPMSKAICV